jgi:hypothetical protein
MAASLRCHPRLRLALPPRARPVRFVRPPVVAGVDQQQQSSKHSRTLVNSHQTELSSRSSHPSSMRISILNRPLFDSLFGVIDLKQGAPWPHRSSPRPASASCSS